ncbi:MAG: chromosomal replication initiator protein DnaA [Pseudomonadota bacterium]|nr:chromosomal replication initiator protein DnaA [Pseudomonadota bacterium]
MEQAWDRFCSALERKIGDQNMEIWIRGTLRPEAIAADRVRLRADSKYYHDWIRDNLLRDIETAWAETMGRRVEVEMSWLGAPADEAPVPLARRSATNLDRSRTFENFVVGKCNEFAHAASIAVADAPGQSHNPLFIYGSTGLGKTHLVHAIGNRVLARSGGNAGVYYCTAENFFAAMVRALQTRTIQEFRERFRTEIDVLILDDVQFLAGRDRTEEELFYVFEAMRAEGKQIVITADEPPRSIGKLEPRLRTRFEGGLLADVQPPDVETMMAILASKAATLRLDVPSDVQYVIAQRVRNSVRELEGVLNRLSALHIFYGQPISMAFIQDRMGDIIPPPAPPPSAEQIINRVAEHYHVRPADIRGDRRPANIARPRQIAMFLTRRITNLSFPEIGRVFNRDNSTVQHGCKKVEADMKTDPNIRAEIEMLEKMCRGN